MFTDSHCHLASHKFSPSELATIVQNAKQHDIHRLVTLATCLEDCPTNLQIAEQFPEVYAAIGIHPCDVHESPDDFLTHIKPFAIHPKCVAIGETGLDYFHPAPKGWTEDQYHQRQKDFLDTHFQLAATLGKNIVIHTRDRSGKQSLEDALDIYSHYHQRVKAVFHCFLGPWENAEKILQLGGAVSFTGIATFGSAKDCLDAAVQAPSGTFMLETDAPYLAPKPHRGKRNEPAYVAHIAQHIAHSRNESLEELARHTESVANRFFHFSSTS